MRYLIITLFVICANCAHSIQTVEAEPEPIQQGEEQEAGPVTD